jgi:hypothetical protein
VVGVLAPVLAGVFAGGFGGVVAGGAVTGGVVVFGGVVTGGVVVFGGVVGVVGGVPAAVVDGALATVVAVTDDFGTVVLDE